MSALDDEFKDLIRNALELLGSSIKIHYGEDIYLTVENIRKHLKAQRNKDKQESIKALSDVYDELNGYNRKKQMAITHSFATALEIINACENAYRTSRLKQEKMDETAYSERITYVLTAHPTESRSTEFIEIINRITLLLLKGILESKFFVEELKYLFLLALRNPVSRSEKPSVKDEAEYIYTLALKEDILKALTSNLENGQTVYLRTWVGGDKDGHPGVNAKVMLESLQASRTKLILIALELLHNFEEDLDLIDKSAQKTQLTQLTKKLKKSLLKSKTITAKDGKLISLISHQLKFLLQNFEKVLLTASPHLKTLNNIFALFPALVVPLELRESSVEISQSLKKKTPILQMLVLLKKISDGGNILSYARGLVISSTESSNDILDAFQLVQKTTHENKLPIVPLFESRNSLEKAESIIADTFKNKEIRETCHASWASRFEIMLGYSDSAKENGSLLSRLLIRKALRDLETLLLKNKITPIFFHGSGGSVARGGGSLEEQVSWWPESSKKIFKVTLQGEMIHRSLSSPEIFKSQVSKILKSASKETPLKNEAPELFDFGYKCSEKYKELINNKEFLNVVEKSTPYSFLNDLKIGSRPTKRVENLGMSSLRAIPWVLCWTQIRSLLPIWWGVGSTWTKLSPEEKTSLKKLYQNDLFLKSFIKLLSFSLAKVDLAIWFSYLQRSELDPSVKKEYEEKFTREFNDCKSFIQEISGEEKLLWFRPWLEQSITLRSTMIHPLNMAQIISLKNKDSLLLRETVTGIASGMLTTG